MTTTKFRNIVQNKSLAVIKSNNKKKDFIHLDLSSENKELHPSIVSDSAKLADYIDQKIKSKKAKFAYGGYLEQRNIYKRSAYFNSKNSTEERNIHLGIDIWADAETPVYAVLDGQVHSFKNNTNQGDYGPTIILQHHIKDLSFYTLYGHLSLASIQDLKLGQSIKQAEIIGTLGDASVNGDYPPHLHFQLIKNIGEYQGDYPGVCSLKELDYYSKNCPNPTFFLGMI